MIALRLWSSISILSSKSSSQKRLANFFHWRKKHKLHPMDEQGTLCQVEWLLPVYVYLELRWSENESRTRQHFVPTLEKRQLSRHSSRIRLSILPYFEAVM